MSKSVLYDSLISEFVHNEEDNRSEWEKVISIHSGFISPAFSQWVRRVLERPRFSVRKESISQNVPLNWNTLCIEAAGVIRSTMARAGVDRLINADEMFLNYYPKDKHLIAPRNVKHAGTNRAEDDKKGCTAILSFRTTPSQCTLSCHPQLGWSPHASHCEEQSGVFPGGNNSRTSHPH